MSYLEILDSELRTVQIDLPLSKKLKLARYCETLARWNRRINLTSLTGVQLVQRLVLEPVWIGMQLKLTGRLLDIGSGNGSPAIPLQIACELELCHLVEARSKRAAFLRHLVTDLRLSSTRVHRARFEEVIQALVEVDWITLQGVTLTPELLDSIKTAFSSARTTVLWITSAGADPGPWIHRTLAVPFSKTQVLSFRLDHS